MARETMDRIKKMYGMRGEWSTCHNVYSKEIGDGFSVSVSEGAKSLRCSLFDNTRGEFGSECYVTSVRIPVGASDRVIKNRWNKLVALATR